MKWLLPLVLAVAYSCASASSDWSNWKIEDQQKEERVWRKCSADKDLPQYVLKGECYISQECRTRNPWYSKEQKECRRLDLFCAWGDIECYVKYDTLNSVIVKKEKLK